MHAASKQTSRVKHFCDRRRRRRRMGMWLAAYGPTQADCYGYERLAGWLLSRARAVQRARTSSVHPPSCRDERRRRPSHVHACYATQLPLTPARTVRVHALATAGPDSDSRDRHGVRCPLSTLAEEVTGTAWRPCYLLESGLPPAGAAVRFLPAPVGRRRPRGSFCSRFARPSTAVSVSETHQNGAIDAVRSYHIRSYAHTATCQDAELTDGRCMYVLRRTVPHVLHCCRAAGAAPVLIVYLPRGGWTKLS